ncbi:MAG: terminase [Firmicutes bacterium]|nr:terminase [Bacillota bacterium]
MDKRSTQRLFKGIAAVVAPPPELTVSEWADEYRILSPESSSAPGRWSTDVAPYMREIMNAVTDPEYENVVIMSSAQVGKTELLLNTLGYFIHYDPSPILVIQPNVEPMAKDFSKDRLAPMIRDTPVLRNRVSEAKTRSSDNTMLHKVFPGGHVTIVGANAASGLASRPIRVVLADEVDRYPASAGTEGDPLALAAKRTVTFWNRKFLTVSTPTIKNVSRIEAAFLGGTQEEWSYPCPACGEFQPLKWGQIRFEDAKMECCRCHERFDEFAWKSTHPEWIAANPNAKNVRSFHLNELSSPWKRWTKIIEEFHDARAKDRLTGTHESYKVWLNTTLGETWEEEAESLDEELITKRRETYNCDIPESALVITASVDVQDDRLEYEVVGWGLGKESWGIRYGMFVGDPHILKSEDPAAPSVWEQLDVFLEQKFEYEDGNALHISCTCIDSGHCTSEVYEFCVKREHRRIFAIKGRGGMGLPILGRPSRNNKKKTALFPIGVDTAKEQLFSRLKVEFPGPGYCHFPVEPEKGYNEGYFKGITAEKRSIRYKDGRPVVHWEKASGARNEPLDLRNYATAALEILNPNFKVLAQTAREKVVEAQNKQVTVSNVEHRPAKRRVLSGGVT